MCIRDSSRAGRQANDGADIEAFGSVATLAILVPNSRGSRCGKARQLLPALRLGCVLLNPTKHAVAAHERHVHLGERPVDGPIAHPEEVPGNEAARSHRCNEVLKLRRSAEEEIKQAHLENDELGRRKGGRRTLDHSQLGTLNVRLQEIGPSQLVVENTAVNGGYGHGASGARNGLLTLFIERRPVQIRVHMDDRRPYLSACGSHLERGVMHPTDHLRKRLPVLFKWVYQKELGVRPHSSHLNTPFTS